MNNLETLVPPPELCKQIPEGAFADSALVWTRTWCRGEPCVQPREEANENGWTTYAPAPTLQEIMDALGAATCYHLGETWTVALCNDSLDNGVKDANPATAALKLWMAIGTETEND